MPSLSVIVCSHNPRREHLAGALDHLSRQSLPVDEWELLIVDNSSTVPLSSAVDISWHPRGRVLREETLGLTPARLRGIRESSGEIIIFVDDDNLLATNYLEVALGISDVWPQLGAWSGQCHPEFEEPPEEWTRPYWSWLAIREFSDDRWSNQGEPSALPWGAGMCVRRSCAEAYARRVGADGERAILDRRGSALTSGGDTDLVLQVCESGYGTGVFAALELQHLIPPTRLTEEYLTRFAEASMYTKVLMDEIHGRSHHKTRARRIVNFIRLMLSRGRERRFRMARARGERSALCYLQEQRQADAKG